MEFSITLRVGMKRNDNFYFLTFPAFSNLFWLIMKPHWYFLIFWIFLLFSWNFLLHVGQEQNGTIMFIFSLSQPLPTYFGLKWGSNGTVLIFWIFLLFFFGTFYYTPGRNGTEWNDNFYFSFLIYFQPILAWNEFIMVLFNFFVIFLEFSITRRIGTKRNDNFYFLSFPAFSSLFWLKMKPQWYFLIFWIFLPIF